MSPFILPVKGLSKVNLCAFNTLSKSIEINDPIYLLLSNYNELRDSKDYITGWTFRFLYFNKEKTHEILYNYEEFIKIKDTNREYKLSDYFYLSLLIKDNPNIINYTYSFDFIKSVNDFNQNNIFIIKKIVLCKIINDLIHNYKNLDNQKNEKEEEEVKRIEEENNMGIRNGFSNLKELGLNLVENIIRNKKRFIKK